jgi:hypothetical protein
MIRKAGNSELTAPELDRVTGGMTLAELGKAVVDGALSAKGSGIKNLTGACTMKGNPKGCNW